MTAGEIQSLGLKWKLSYLTWDVGSEQTAKSKHKIIMPAFHFIGHLHSQLCPSIWMVGEINMACASRKKIIHTRGLQEMALQESTGMTEELDK